MNELAMLWERHRDAAWPRGAGQNEGELMTLDTVISGCVTYFLESEEGLDPQRVEIVEGCLADLTALLPELPEHVLPYFERLRALAQLLLELNQNK